MLKNVTITFKGEVSLEELPDDAGSVDNWVVSLILEAINNGPELDDIYSNLKLEWSIKD